MKDIALGKQYALSAVLVQLLKKEMLNEVPQEISQAKYHKLMDVWPSYSSGATPLCAHKTSLAKRHPITGERWQESRVQRYALTLG